jgi:hypothetical protein
MSHQQIYEGVEPLYRGSGFSTTERIHSSKQRRPSYGRRRGKSPQSFNGIHRRRRRKLAW